MELSNNNSEIKDIFALSPKDHSNFEQWSSKEIDNFLITLRKRLEYSGKMCNLYSYLVDCAENDLEELYNKEENPLITIFKDKISRPRWRTVYQIRKQVYDMMGYLSLLQMDAITTIINLFQAKSDTERIMQCKHAYTIVFEAIENDMFKKVSKEIKQYPKEILNEAFPDEFWKVLKKRKLLKAIKSLDTAEEIRNNIDAHQNSSFKTQLTAYKKCSWTKSIINFTILMIIVEEVQNRMEIVDNNVSKLSKQFFDEINEASNQLNNLITKLREEINTKQ